MIKNRAEAASLPSAQFYSSSRNTRDFSHGTRAQKGKLTSSWVQSRDEEQMLREDAHGCGAEDVDLSLHCKDKSTRTRRTSLASES